MLTKLQQEGINANKFCMYCGAPVAHGNGWLAVGQCQEHRKIWEEDIRFGLSKRNRLKELQNLIDSSIEPGDQLKLELQWPSAKAITIPAFTTPA